MSAEWKVTLFPVRTMLGDVALDLRRGDECGWMTGRGGGHTPVFDGVAFPRAPGVIAGPADVLSAPWHWTDALAPCPTRAEQERQENAQCREALVREVLSFGIAPSRVIELLKAANAGAEYVEAWEAATSGAGPR
jgi:hypothetical protein